MESEVLANPSPQAGQSYELTGPEAHSMDEVAQVLSRVLGRAPTTFQSWAQDARSVWS